LFTTVRTRRRQKEIKGEVFPGGLVLILFYLLHKGDRGRPSFVLSLGGKKKEKVDVLAIRSLLRRSRLRREDKEEGGRSPRSISHSLDRPQSVREPLRDFEMGKEGSDLPSSR